MIDSNLWEILVTFEECGTLIAAAEKLYVSQPSLSAAMKRLEKELGITLFERSKNRLVLNEVGYEAVRLARQHLSFEQTMVSQLQGMARRLSTITVASYVSGLRKMLADRLSELYPNRSIASEHVPSELLPGGLADGRFDFVISEHIIDEPDVVCVPYMIDHLMVRLRDNDPLAGKKSISLRDLNEGKLLVWTQSGFWASFIRKKLSEKIPLVFVSNEQEYHELLQAFDMRALILESTIVNRNLESIYHCVPLDEADMQVPFYLCTLQKNAAAIAKLVQRKPAAPHPGEQN